MSRTPYSRRARSPSSYSNAGSDVQIPMPNQYNTRPLQINRPTTPTSNAYGGVSTSPRSQASAGPSRPQRSELRNRAARVSEYSDTSQAYAAAVLDQVKEEWEFVTDPDFNNVDLALELLDESSVGKDIRAFRRTKDLLSKALKGSVDKHYQAFAAALPHHASLISHLTATQTQITDTRSALTDVKDSLGNKRADLVQLWGRGQMLEEMMKLLDQIEHLKSVPDLLETLMSEKRLLQASVLLVRSLKIINKQEMLEIGAVADLRSYLSSQEIALRDILADELQSHLYLKSFWCDSRWASYVPGQQTFPKVEYDESLPSTIEEDGSPTTPTTRTSRKTRLHRFLQQLAIKPNDPPDDPNDLSSVGLTSDGLSHGRSISAITQLTPSTSTPDSNPEADSFAYMETLLESLAVLGKLGSALDAVGQRVQGEVFSLIESTLDEVSDRAEYGKRGEVLSAGPARADAVYTFAAPAAVGGPGGAPGVVLKGGLVNAAHLRLAALESAAKQVDHDTLRDFFWTLYSKLDAVSQGMRVVYEVANRIGSRRDFKDSSGAKPGTLFPLNEAWSSIQAEIRTLLHDYLTDEEQGAASGRNPISSINEMLRDSKFNTRDKSKSIFRFADIDSKLTNKILKSHEDELTRVLKDTVPGLVQGSESTVHAALSIVGADDRVLGAGASQHHRLLIHPDAFHVSVLFQPTLAYLERVQDNLPAGKELARTLSTVLDDFVLKVYLPQLEEKVAELFAHAVNGPDALQPDPASARLCSEPLIKSATQLMALINSLCVMLQTTPFHRENYSRLILGVIIQFYQRCSDWFQSLVSTPGAEGEAPRVALAAQWAQRNEMSTCLTELQSTADNLATKQQQLCRQQVNVELEWCDKEITAKDLISSTRTVASLASLYRSVSWFAAQLGSWNTTSDDDDSQSPTTMTLEPPLSAMSISLPTLPPPAEGLHLPLSKEMNMRFHALLKTYEQLSELILHTIRVDIHCRTIYHLESALRSGNYHLEHEASEPDPHVNELNIEMGEIDDFASTALPKHERQFIFVGLGHLMEHVIISKAALIRQPTAFGIKKMLRNMFALRQGIKTIANDPYNTEFERAKKYFALYFMSPQDMLESIRSKPVFTFDEYETMLKFQCGLDSTKGKTDRNYSMFVIELHGLELERSS
ncbi:Sec8 exocyst complex component-specific domain-containing protein [Schizophyllum commune]